MAELDHVAVAHALGVAHERPPRAQPGALVQRHADPRLAAPAFELGGDDARVVEHQHVAGAQQVGEVGDAAVAQPLALDDQHARRVARARGAEGDAVGGQVEVEQVDLHGWTGAAPAAAARPAPPAGARGERSADASRGRSWSARPAARRPRCRRPPPCLRSPGRRRYIC